MSDFLNESLAVLARTPAVFDVLLRDLPEAWTNASEGPGTWSPYVVAGHLVYCEKVDWMPRLRIILKHGTARPFDPFDREGQLKENRQASLAELLDEFSALRRENIEQLHALNLQADQLELQGMHPALGVVTLRQLLAMWTAHDLAHLVQVNRVMARRYREDVGPWVAYSSVLK